MSSGDTWPTVAQTPNLLAKASDMNPSNNVSPPFQKHWRCMANCGKCLCCVRKGMGIEIQATLRHLCNCVKIQRRCMAAAAKAHAIFARVLELRFFKRSESASALALKTLAMRGRLAIACAMSARSKRTGSAWPAYGNNPNCVREPLQ